MYLCLAPSPPRQTNDPVVSIGCDTVLGETEYTRELFLVKNSCEEVNLEDIVRTVDVSFWQVDPAEWAEMGGTEEAVGKAPISDSEHAFYFRMR